MNSDFPRIISLLRKERNISQKQAAADLGVSQALLSHYEKGIRECGLDFLVRAADYYNVSCDYLLGRSPEPSGKVISAAELPESGESAQSREHKLVTGSADILFSLAKKTGSATVLKSVSDYLMLAAYKMFRIVYSANSRNDSRFFSIPDPAADHLTDAAMSVSAAAAKAAAHMLVSGEVIGEVSLMTPADIRLYLEVEDIVKENNYVSCAIRKDSGDDPDVTNGILVYAKVRNKNESAMNL